MARELKLSSKKIDAINRAQTKNQKDNERIKAELGRLGIPDRYENRMRYKLWEDLNEDPLKRCCPFCGKPIDHKDIFSASFEIEHLLPFSRSFDDGRNNKVLACKECNNFKKHRTPWEAFHTHHSGKYDWDKILGRAEQIRGISDNGEFQEKGRKFGRFLEKASVRLTEDTLLKRFLTDTQYMSRIAKEYLKCLSPKGIEDVLFVRSIPGQLTAKMRDIWQFNGLLSDQSQKNRADHRHHAIDALTIACTERSTLLAFSSHSRESYERRHKIIDGELLPFPNFNRTELKRLVDKMVISYKPDHKGVVAAVQQGKTIGPLHDETNYALVNYVTDDGCIEKRYATRKDINSLKNIDEIGDLKIRNDIRKRIVGLNKEQRQQAIKDYAEKNDIHTVRIHKKADASTMIGLSYQKGERLYRYVASGNNYCMDVYCPNRGEYKGQWCAEVISNFDAHQKNFTPKWRPKEPEAKLIMRLFINDIVAYDNDDGKTIICRVKKMSGPYVWLLENKIVKEEKNMPSWCASARQLQKRNARRIKVDALGCVFDPQRKK